MLGFSLTPLLFGGMTLCLVAGTVVFSIRSCAKRGVELEYTRKRLEQVQRQHANAKATRKNSDQALKELHREVEKGATNQEIADKLLKVLERKKGK